jgi:adenylosuccinate lyase
MKDYSGLESLTAISPIDGRYRDRLSKLAHYFSESGFIRYKVQVEVEYFIALCKQGLPQLNNIPADAFEVMRDLYRKFSPADAERVKEIEKVTNHDVKAVEYFIKDKMADLLPSLEEAKEFVHFGLTSQDINNTAVPMMLRDALRELVIPGLENLEVKLAMMANNWKDVSMLARTHGQPASPTKVGKELRVFITRLNLQIASLKLLPYPAKFGGATGNFNAHAIAFPGIDWHEFAEDFVNDGLGLHRSFPTTQIEHYDGLAAIFDNLKRINTILIDLSVDFWLYISQEYFIQKTVAGEVGSSAMPHKVNPIDFENAEGNLGFANAVFNFLSGKLPVSRLQRDLTDSTVLRNTGVAVAHSWLAVQSLDKGLDKIELNQSKIDADLSRNWAVVSEAIQTILRREAYPNPYEQLKALTRGNREITEESIHQFIESLDVSEELKAEMKNITPWNYTGLA